MSGTETLLKLLKTILKEINYNDAKIDIKPVSSDGANYTSGLYEITVDNKHKETLHLFAKVAIMSDNLRKEIGPQQIVYEIEDKVYKKIATAYEELQDKHGIPKDERFIFSKFYGSSLEVGNEMYIFENLNLKGYQIFDRFVPMDYQSLFDTTTALAKFHALGLALETERPELHKQFNSKEIFVGINNFVESSRDQVSKYVKAIDEEYRGRVEKYLEDGCDKLKKFNAHEGKFLIHGDYRCSNIMFKKEGDKVVVVPLDYQGTRVGSAVTDLLYFITMSTDETFRVNHFEELLDHYYIQLSLFLGKLGIDVNNVYPRQVFQEEIKELLPGTLQLALTLFPIIFVEGTEAPIVSDNKMKLSSFYVNLNAKSLERLTGYVRDCARWGII